jgi:hypothetical protein
MGCTVFIDESGDTGIRKVRADGRPGASEYFVLAAAVMPNATQIVARKLLEELEQTIGKTWRHATDLNHSQTVFLCRSVSKKLNLRFFAVVSRKATLGEYANEISWNPHMFYNKCAHYLLECVGGYLKAKGMFSDDPDVIFEGRNHDFDALRRYVGKIKKTPHHTRAQNLQCFNPFGFVERAKHEELLLKYADLAAHAVYQCVNKTPANFGIPEPRYLSELESRFGADEYGKILGNGLKCIHTLDQVIDEKEIKDLWQKMRAKPLISIRN